MATQPKAPKYQNKFAFAHNPNSKKSQIIAGIPNVGLCQRCHDIIEWRKKFRKYKPIKNLTKCASCSEKKVRSAYHLWCTDCAKGANVCPKCLLNRDIVQAEVAELTQEQIHEMMVQVGMKERVRRRVWRLWESGKASDAEIKEIILNYNPADKDDAKDEEEDEEEEEAQRIAAAQAAARARRGPPPKPKADSSAASAGSSSSAPASSAPAASAVAPAAASSVSASSSSAAAAPVAAAEEDEDGENEEDDDDGDYDDESEGDAEEEAQFQREQAAKRGAAPKPKAEAIEQKMAAASIAEK